MGQEEVVSHLCKLLKVQEKSRLCMKAQRGVLSRPSWKRRRLDIADAPSISLRTALANHHLSRTSRLSLIVIIANSSWQYYSSKWMPRPWTKDDLYFLREEGDGEENLQIYAHRPHLGTVFEVADPTDTATGRQHHHPKILALGIMLLEIELGLDLHHEWKTKDLRANGEPTNNTDYITALDILADDMRWSKRETIPAVKKAIRTCLEDDFEDCINTEDEREAVQKKVIVPLESIWNVVSSENLGDITYARLNPMEPKAPFTMSKSFVKRVRRASTCEYDTTQPAEVMISPR